MVQEGGGQGGSHRRCSSCGVMLSPHAPTECCVVCVLRAAKDAVRAPQRIGRYEVKRLIGEGCMAKVYEAIDPELNKPVALKVLKHSAFIDDEAEQAFVEACRTHAGIDHPHVATISDGEGLLCSPPYYKMERCSGTLGDSFWLSQGKDLQLACRWMIQVASGVHAAHRRGLLWLDAKPSNVLMRRDGDPAVTDFSHAVSFEQGRINSCVIGTLQFMSPEQANAQALDVRTDVYGLGALLYCLITQQPPRKVGDGDDIEDLRELIRRTPIVAPSLRKPGVDKRVEAVCMRALQTEPSKRHPSAQAFALDLQQALDHAQRAKERTSLLGMIAMAVFIVCIGSITFRQREIDNNFYSAALEAKLIREYLVRSAAPIERLASDIDFQQIVSSGDTRQIERTLHLVDSDLTTSGRRSDATGNWMLLTEQGRRLVRIPDEGEVSADRSLRDYYTGAMKAFETAGKAQLHMSKVLKSRDDAFYKMGLSIAIPDPRNAHEVCGVLVLMLKTDSSESRNLGLGDPLQQRRTVVVAPWDDFHGTDRPHVRWVVWAHPRYRAGDDAVEIATELKLPGRSALGLYFDPAASRFADYAGPWAAGSAQVPGTHLVVIVQTRIWALIWLTGIGGCMVFAAASVMIRRWQHRLRRNLPGGWSRLVTVV